MRNFAQLQINRLNGKFRPIINRIFACAFFSVENKISLKSAQVQRSVQKNSAENHFPRKKCAKGLTLGVNVIINILCKLGQF
jgi:hypothetical protein